MQKNVLLVILGIVAAGALGLLVYNIYSDESDQINTAQNEVNVADNEDNNEPGTTVVQEEKVRVNVVANEVITSPLELTGEAAGWYFEGSFPVRLEDKDGNLIAQSYVTAKDNWMTEDFVSFEGEIKFDPVNVSEGQLILQKDNPSGLPENDEEVKIPVKFQQETMEVSVYFNNTQQDAEMLDCGNVFPTTRRILRTPRVGAAAIYELLKGPTAAEVAQGFQSQISSGVELRSLRIENGVAYADFNSTLDYQVGGSCRVSAIRAQIAETLKQFPTVDSVIISIGDRVDDVLQP